jgi:hypothetical protein
MFLGYNTNGLAHHDLFDFSTIIESKKYPQPPIPSPQPLIPSS